LAEAGRIEVWRPITDVGPTLATYRDPELANLRPAWADRRRELEAGQALHDWNERLARAWSIETGILERLYTLDRGVTHLFLEHGFNASLLGHGTTDIPAADLIAMLRAHREALAGLFAFVRGERPLTTSYLKELHAALTRAQDWVQGLDPAGRPVQIELRRGEWKRQNNNPARADGTVFAYCPWQQVPGQMEDLIRLHRGHDALAPEVSAAWLHHRFTQIHPFQDGNGRVARALASLAFIRAGLFPLVIDRDERAEYIGCLETADAGDLRPLVGLMAAVERRALLHGLGLAAETLSAAAGVAASARAIALRLKRSEASASVAAEQSDRVAAELAEVGWDRLKGIRASMLTEFAAAGLDAGVNVSRSTEETAHYFEAQIQEVARRLDYVVGTAGPRRWVRLQLSHGASLELMLSFHSVGAATGGACACIAFVSVRQRSGEEQSPSVWRVEPAGDVYAFSGVVPIPETLQAFEPWLDRVVARGLNLIRERL